MPPKVEILVVSVLYLSREAGKRHWLPATKLSLPACHLKLASEPVCLLRRAGKWLCLPDTNSFKCSLPVSCLLAGKGFLPACQPPAAKTLLYFLTTQKTLMLVFYIFGFYMIMLVLTIIVLLLLYCFDFMP